MAIRIVAAVIVTTAPRPALLAAVPTRLRGDCLLEIDAVFVGDVAPSLEFVGVPGTRGDA